MNEIKTIIFSKNRPCQLELLLRSLNIPATILFTYDPEFEEGYNKLIKMYPNFDFVKETDFKRQIIVLSKSKKYVMFLCDDDIMINPFDKECSEFYEFKKDNDILCLTLRLCKKYQRAPSSMKDNKWEWKNEPKDWGYPMSVTSNIFRRDDILPVMEREIFTNPNNLEVKLRRNAPDRPLMMCFDEPKIINNLANQVQKQYPNPNHANVSLIELNQRFLNGEKLSLKYIKEKAKESNCCFLATDFVWGDNWLSGFKKNITSQRGEDGIIKKIFEVLDIKKGWCVDVGAYGKQLSNTYNLINNGWGGILLEMDKSRYLDLVDLYRGKDNIYCFNGEIQSKGMDSLEDYLDRIVLPYDLDFLTIDVDGKDYYIWKHLLKYTPKVVVIEFNPTFGFNDYLQEENGEGGASLSKMIELGKSKGYELITTTNFNAFFVRKDLFDKFEINNNSIKELFVENNDSYGEKTKI